MASALRHTALSVLPLFMLAEPQRSYGAVQEKTKRKKKEGGIYRMMLNMHAYNMHGMLKEEGRS